MQNLTCKFIVLHSIIDWSAGITKMQLIRRVIDGFNWRKAFSNESVNEKVDTFNQTILNVLSTFIPHETRICDDRDPPWFNKKSNLLHTKKNTSLKSFAAIEIIVL